MAELYIFSQYDELLTVITEETGLVSAPFREELNRVPEEPFSFIVEADSEDAKYVVEENQVVFRDKEGDLRLFVIKELDDIDNVEGPQTKAICEPAFMELKEHIIVERRPTNVTQQQALDVSLEGTRWIGEVEVDLGLNSTHFYYISSVDAIWKIIDTWGGDFKDVVEFDEKNNIVARKIKILQRRGADRGKRFEIDHDIEEIQRTVLSYPVTALYGRGASLEILDEEGEHTGGYTRYIDFADVEWSKAKGDPIDKPLGQKWVGDPDALEKYGYLKNDGSKLHRFGIVENHDIEDPKELLEWTWQQLQNLNKPEVNYGLSVHLLEMLAGYEHEHVELGDTAAAIDRQFARPIEIQSRVIAIEYDLVDIEGTAFVEMGQFLSVYEDDVHRDIEDLKDRVNRPRPTPPITNDSFPDVKPSPPTNVEAIGGFRTIQLYWDYDSDVYISHYEVYGSQVADFVPDTQHLLWRGRVSAFSHEVDTDQKWYYYVRAVNTRGTASEFSQKVSASTVRIISDDILFGSVLAEHLANNLDIADKLAQNTIDRINQGPMQAIEYTQEQIEATEQMILNKLNTDIGELNSNINSLVEKTADIEGTVTNIKLEVDDIEGRLSTTISQLSNINGILSEHTTQISVLNDEIATKVSTTTYQQEMTTVNNNISQLTTRMGQAETELQQTSAQIALKANKTDVYTKTETDNKFTSVNQQISTLSAQLSVQADQIATKVSRTEFESLQIGGRNLLRNTDFRNGLNNWSNWGTATREVVDLNGKKWVHLSQNDSNRWRGISQEVLSIKPSTPYTVSFIAYSQNNSTMTVGIHQKLGNTIVTQNWQGFTLTNSPKKYSYTFTTIGSSIDQFRFMIGNDQSPFDIYITDIKLEIGNKATDWTPAPEDTQSQIDGVTTRVTNAETSITQLANQISLKANQTTVDSLTNRMSSAESSINLLSNQIKLKVDVDGVISSINLSPEGVRISGNRIHLTGQTLIDDGIIGTAAIANAAITRAKLGTAVIGTAQIEDGAITNAKIASLTADKITSGAIRGIDIYGSQFRSSDGNTRLSIIGGNVRLTQNSGNYVNVNPTGLFGYNSSNSMTFRVDKTLVTSSALGTSVENVYLGAYGEARVVNYNDIPGDGQVGSYRYLPLRASNLFADSLDVNNGINLYLRTYSNGEVRVTNVGSTTSYRALRASNYFGDSLDANAGPSVYIRPFSNGEVRITNTGTTTSFRPLRASNLYGDSIAVNNSADGTNLYLQSAWSGEVRATALGSTTSYVPLRASNLYAASLDTNTGGSVYVRPSSNGSVHVTVTGTTNNYRPIYASQHLTGSLEGYKQDIEEFKGSALDIIHSAKVHKYRLKSDVENGINHIKYGLIIGEGYATPLEYMSADNKAIDSYVMSAINLKAIQELDLKIRESSDNIDWLRLENDYLKQKVSNLETRIKLLEERVA